MSYPSPTNVEPYPFWNKFTPTLPTLYWDVDSQEERIKKICLELHKVIEYVDYVGQSTNLDRDIIKQLESDFQDFIDGAYDDYYKDEIYKYIQEKFPELIRYAIKNVYFGLTSDGHFCAYIPDSWSDIEFDTGAVYGTETYGRLILRMDVDSPNWGVIDNMNGGN